MQYRAARGAEGRPRVCREYEYAGYVIKGVAELTTSGNVLRLNPGSAYLIPAGSPHSFRIIEGPFQACEATCPPYFVHNRDKPIDKAQARV